MRNMGTQFSCFVFLHLSFNIEEANALKRMVADYNLTSEIFIYPGADEGFWQTSYKLML